MSDVPQVTIVFPMAGRGARFGNTFKPFLRVGDETFIEAAVRPFRKWSRAVRRFVFVFLREQESEWSVSGRLAQMFPELPLATVALERPTAGPAETLAAGLAATGTTGRAIICDCDHAVNVDPLFELISNPAEEAECVLPVWDLAGEDPRSWSIAAVEPDGRVTAIAEKRPPDGGGLLRGVIGCYYFRQIEKVVEVCRERTLVHLSDAIGHLLTTGRRVMAVQIREAEFFGDPRRLDNALQRRAPRAPAARSPDAID